MTTRRRRRSAVPLLLLVMLALIAAGVLVLDKWDKTDALSVPLPGNEFSVPLRATDAANVPALYPGKARLVYDALGINAPWVWVGLDAAGDMNSPQPADSAIGRLENTSHAPDTDWAPGVVFLGGHVEWNQTKGVLFRLAQAQPYQRLYLSGPDGTTQAYEVTALKKLPHNQPVAPAMFRAKGWKPGDKPTLVLTTCGGDLSAHIFTSAIFIIASPVGPTRSA